MNDAGGIQAEPVDIGDTPGPIDDAIGYHRARLSSVSNVTSRRPSLGSMIGYRDQFRSPRQSARFRPEGLPPRPRHRREQAGMASRMVTLVPARA